MRNYETTAKTVEETNTKFLANEILTFLGAGATLIVAVAALTVMAYFI